MPFSARHTGFPSIAICRSGSIRWQACRRAARCLRLRKQPEDCRSAAIVSQTSAVRRWCVTVGFLTVLRPEMKQVFQQGFQGRAVRKVIGLRYCGAVQPPYRSNRSDCAGVMAFLLRGRRQAMLETGLRHLDLADQRAVRRKGSTPSAALGLEIPETSKRKAIRHAAVDRAEIAAVCQLCGCPRHRRRGYGRDP